MSLQSIHQNTSFDAQLDNIKHFQLYPEMRPWIGDHYDEQKILIVAESHYMEEGSTFHHDAKAWYQKRADVPEHLAGWMNTRGVVSYHCGGNRTIGEIGKTLAQCDFFRTKPDMDRCNAYRWVAFMNFFQRPANEERNEIAPTQADKQHSNEIFRQIVDALSPRMIVFASKNAFKNLDKATLNDKGIPYTPPSTHPTSAWWNRADSSGTTGKQRFMNLINEHARA